MLDSNPAPRRARLIMQNIIDIDTVKTDSERMDSIRVIRDEALARAAEARRVTPDLGLEQRRWERLADAAEAVLSAQTVEQSYRGGAPPTSSDSSTGMCRS